INSNDIKEALIYIPAQEEQIQIGSFFKNLDQLITIHQRRGEVLQKLKKVFLQRMLVPETDTVPNIRFSGYTYAWKKHVLGKIAPLRGGFAFKSSSFSKKGVPIIRISNILSNGSVGGSFAFYNEQLNDEKYSLPDKAALLAMSGATVGKVSILNNPLHSKFYQNQRVGYFIQSVETDYNFVSILVRSHLFIKQLDSVLVSGAQPNVSSKEIDMFSFMVPHDKQEQTQIGQIFQSLDNLIAVNHRKLEIIKKIKKAFLQKMFV
ncbi:MAG: restriction endonuclease subunit S, partial [Lactobacillaceae bacterium]|nr:restriction endonuclease subunit S [Lactobacillaceae bacterium]